MSKLLTLVPLTWLNGQSQWFYMTERTESQRFYMIEWTDSQRLYMIQWTESQILHDWMDRVRNLSSKTVEWTERDFTWLNGQRYVTWLKRHILHDWMDRKRYFTRLSGQKYVLHDLIDTVRHILHDWMDRETDTLLHLIWMDEKKDFPCWSNWYR